MTITLTIRLRETIIESQAFERLEEGDLSWHICQIAPAEAILPDAVGLVPQPLVLLAYLRVLFLIMKLC